MRIKSHEPPSLRFQPDTASMPEKSQMILSIMLQKILMLNTQMPSKKPCGTRLSDGKSVTSVVVSSGTYAPVLRSAYGELLRHSAVSSTPVFRQLGTACRIVCNEWSVFA